MKNLSEIKKIQDAAKIRILFLPHAIRQMARPDRMISPKEIESVVDSGEIIEAYLNDERGPSYLMMGKVKNRAIHCVCSPKEQYLAIITAYMPDKQQWDAAFTKRRT